MDLKQLAIEISQVYKRNTKVEAVLLGGSVSRGWQDSFSDIELFVLWRENPSDEDRKASIEEVNGSIIDLYPYEEEEWSETYVAKGVKFEISNFLTSTIEKVMSAVVKENDTDLDKQCLVATIHNGQSICGEEVIQQLKKKIEIYPVELSKAMIMENIELGSRWFNREALLNRKDFLMLYKVIVSVQTNLMGILFGLNRLYVHHPAFKWQKQSFEMMQIVPKDAYKRFTSILLNHPKEGLAELEALIEEVYQLIKKEYPSLEISEVIERSLFLRPKNNTEKIEE